MTIPLMLLDIAAETSHEATEGRPPVLTITGRAISRLHG